ncbi:transcriptional regulator [Herbaspirillum rubrisubalbicans]|uniref:helix-turn-helix domain-containing protein n=1 Tax=Herbaspirillum rubrisubalbicans TaxID=80842 RepID=UPI00209F9F31|nr:transcriptional regulator [Herbaspirillum rubrisubalbicans]MCP1571807.1 transcriptional regulator with XRE-family HTH domain [Herbaspirillum rubrisubalbicans]
MSSNKSEFLTILGDRLAEERGRCGHTQKSVADQLEITARTQIKYEIGETAPDAYYLHGLGEIGIDVTYVLTGVRGVTPSQEESELLSCFRGVDAAMRSALVQLLTGLSQMSKAAKKKRDFPAASDAKRTRPGRQRKVPVGQIEGGGDNQEE